MEVRENVDRYVAKRQKLGWRRWVRPLRENRTITPYLYLLPAVALIILTYFYPIIRVIWDSLFRFTGGSAVYVGFRNYEQLLQTPDVITAFQ